MVGGGFPSSWICLYFVGAPTLPLSPISPTPTVQSPSPPPPACLLLPLSPTLFPDFPQTSSPHLVGSAGPMARGNRTWTAEDTGLRVKQWKNEKRQNNAGRAFVTLAPLAPHCSGGYFWSCSLAVDDEEGGDAEGRGGRVVGLGQGWSKKVD